MTVNGLVFNRKNRANRKNSREFNRYIIESRNRSVCDDGNGNRECIGSGNMAYVITAMKKHRNCMQMDVQLRPLCVNEKR